MDNYVEFRHPFTCVIAGPTGCGKTTWVKKFLKERSTLMHPPPENVVWAYGVWQPEYREMMGREVNAWVEGIPDMESFDPKVNNLLIVDDLMLEADSSLTKLFTKGSHHLNISILYLVQNLFQNGTAHRTISLNAHYLVVFKNPRDANQITHFAKQMYPGNIKFLQEAYKDSTSNTPHGYLLIDLKQATPEHLRVRTSIFKDQPTHVYLQK